MSSSSSYVSSKPQYNRVLNLLKEISLDQQQLDFLTPELVQWLTDTKQRMMKWFTPLIKQGCENKLKTRLQDMAYIIAKPEVSGTIDVFSVLAKCFGLELKGSTSVYGFLSKVQSKTKASLDRSFGIPYPIQQCLNQAYEGYKSYKTMLLNNTSFIANYNATHHERTAEEEIELLSFDSLFNNDIWMGIPIQQRRNINFPILGRKGAYDYQSINEVDASLESVLEPENLFLFSSYLHLEIERSMINLAIQDAIKNTELDGADSEIRQISTIAKQPTLLKMIQEDYKVAPKERGEEESKTTLNATELFEKAKNYYVSWIKRAAIRKSIAIDSVFKQLLNYHGTPVQRKELKALSEVIAELSVITSNDIQNQRTNLQNIKNISQDWRAFRQDLADDSQDKKDIWDLLSTDRDLKKIMDDRQNLFNRIAIEAEMIETNWKGKAFSFKLSPRHQHTIDDWNKGIKKELDHKFAAMCCRDEILSQYPLLHQRLVRIINMATPSLKADAQSVPAMITNQTKLFQLLNDTMPNLIQGIIYAHTPQQRRKQKEQQQQESHQ